MFKKYTNWLQQWIPVVSLFGFFMDVSGTGIKFCQQWEQTNKSLIPLTYTEMIAQDYQH